MAEEPQEAAEPTEESSEGGPEQTDPETLERIVTLAFGGDVAKYDEFIARLRAVIPDDGEVILRGSAVTGKRGEDGAPFDADGPGTSDLDVTFVGGGMTQYWMGFYLPGMHTLPLSEEHPNACPHFVPLRDELCEFVGRPVNIQATSSLVQFARDVMMRQPYFKMIHKRGDGAEAVESVQQ